jgi:uncharacterized membrane protein required for colicin V production
MTPMDIYILTIFVAAFVVGFFWGALRSLTLLATWLVAFLGGAHLKLLVGSYLARQWANLEPAFNEMAAFGIVYLGILAVAPPVIFIASKGDQGLVRWETLNDLAGGMLAFAAAVLTVAGLIIVLQTFYGAPNVDVRMSPSWTADLHRSLTGSTLGASVEERVIPLMEPLLRLLVPGNVAEAMAR